MARTLWREERLRAALELVLLGLLLRERLDDVDADDVLLGDRRDVGHLLLDVAQHRMRDVAVAVGDARPATGENASATSASFHEIDEEQHPDADDGEDVLEEEDQPVAEEEAHALEVDGRARHQLPGLVAVEVAEREPHELRVERVPQVELDAERLLAGDQPPADRADAP